MRHFLISVLVLLCETPPPNEPPVKREVPTSFAGSCQFGPVRHVGSKIVIEGQNWTAVGEIDGEIVTLFWMRMSDLTPGIGVYKIDNGNWTGFWGYEGSCEILPSGDLTGSMSAETIVLKKP